MEQSPQDHSERGQWVVRSVEAVELAPGSLEAEPVGIDELPEAMGYIETLELQSLRAEWVAGIVGEANDVRERAIAYQEQAEALMASLAERDSSLVARFQIGLLLVKATVQRDGSKPEYYREDLGDARDYAEGMGFTDVVMAIDRELYPQQEEL